MKLDIHVQTTPALPEPTPALLQIEVAFDATERQPRPARVQIAIGRDADCIWSIFSGRGETKPLSVTVKEITP